MILHSSIIAIIPALMAAVSAPVDLASRPVDLLAGFYRTAEIDLKTGEAIILRRFYQPTFSESDYLPPQIDPKADPEGIKKYQSYLDDTFDMKFGNGKPSEGWYFYKVCYSNEKRRVEQSRLKKESYEAAMNGELSFDSLISTKAVSDGTKMISFNSSKTDPEGTVSKHILGIPDFNRFGRARCSREASRFMVSQLLSDKYVVSGTETDDGYFVVATSESAGINRIELICDPKNDMRVNVVREFLHGHLMDEEIFAGYKKTASGFSVPMSVIRRKYAPFTNTTIDSVSKKETPSPILTFEEEFTVLSVDFNIDVSDENFKIMFPDGTRVVDISVSPTKNYIVGADKKKPKKILVARPVDGAQFAIWGAYLIATGFVAILVWACLRHFRKSR